MSAKDHLSLLRTALSVYFCCFFWRMIPFSAELSRTTPLPHEFLGPLAALFVPLDQTSLAIIFFVLGCCGALAALNVFRRWDAGLFLLLWFGWAICTNFYIHLEIPSDGFIGWMALALAANPSRQQLDLRIQRLGWIITAIAYTTSGLNKLESPGWLNGDALSIVLHSPVVRPEVQPLVEKFASEGFLRFMTFGTLAFEVSFALLCCWSPTRRLAWWSMTALHLGILATLQITDVSVGMLIAQIFLAKPEWLPPLRAMTHKELSPALSPPPPLRS